MDYSKIMKFKGNWRSYQARVLQNTSKYISDGKIHIVAAPGSGKTTLGIELIGRMAEPALVLAPSITIREQWVERIESGFLNEGLNSSDYLSQDLKNPRVITVVTYQALHSAMTRYKGTLPAADETDDSERGEEVDYTGFDVVAAFRESKIKTLCLDECHHLRAEWWKALEEFKRAIGEVKVIALTATPPYDSMPAFWKRYMDMCGEIDEEISIPELVKEGSLCPHQDFVYFNYPTEDEQAEVDKFGARSRACYEKLLWDEGLQGAVATHGCLKDQDDAWDALLKDRDYMRAFFAYLTAGNVPVPQSVQMMAGGRAVQMTPELMERLLQGFLYEDAAYDAGAYRDALEAELKSQGLIEKKKVTLTTNAAVEKLLTTSKGKCNSIAQIVSHEYATLGAGLRLLVLTDYIRKEYERVIGDPDSEVTALGVLPFFEQLRRQMPAQMRLGVLCGTIVIIPAEAKDALLAAVGDNKVNFSAVGHLPEDAYVKVTAVGDAHFLTGAVTEIFAKGCMQVLIGTKSLLGEGWDSPCINSLILASFVGSFMLSNQMRGRAIRVFKEQPEKTSNIWHLVCLPADGDVTNGDYALLVRRMEHFLGLHYTRDQIESGIGRLSIIRTPFDAQNVAQMNEQMLALASRRDSLKERWMRALELGKKQEIVDETELAGECIPGMLYTRAVKGVVQPAVAAAVFGILGIAASATPLGLPCALAAGVCGVVTVARIPKMLAARSSGKRLKSLADGVHRAMCRLNLLEDTAGKAGVDEDDAHRLSVYLAGGTSRDKELFSQCMKELFGAIDSQRYVLKSTKRSDTPYYGVPEVFGKRKEDAEVFHECVGPMIGAYTLVYTRNEAGRKTLLDARMKTAQNVTYVGSSKKRLKG